MSGSEQGGRIPEGAKDFKFEKDADIAAVEPTEPKSETVVVPKYYEGQLYDEKMFAKPDEFNAAFMDAVDAGYLVKNEKGQWLVTASGAKEFSEPTEAKPTSVKTGFAAFRQAAPGKRTERPMFSSSHHKPVKSVEEVKPGKSIAQLDAALARGNRSAEKNSPAEQDPDAEIISLFKKIFSKFEYTLAEHTLAPNGYTDDGEETFKFNAEWFSNNGAAKKKIIKRTFKGTITEILEELENFLNK